MATGEWANGHSRGEDEIGLIGQHVSNLYGLAGHEVGLKPSCACVGLV